MHIVDSELKHEINLDGAAQCESLHYINTNGLDIQWTSGHVDWLTDVIGQMVVYHMEFNTQLPTIRLYLSTMVGCIDYQYCCLK